MPTKIDEAYVEITAKDAKLQKSLKNVDSRMNKTAKTAAKLGTAIKAVFAGAGAVAAIRTTGRFIALANEQIRAETKLAGVLRSTGGAAGLTTKQIKQYASELQRLNGIGDEVTINAAAILATFKDISGVVFKDTLKVAQDMSFVLGTDLNSSIVQLGKALNDPKIGLTALRRVGVSFSEQQIEQIKNLIEENKLLDAQVLILRELESQFGKTADAFGETKAGQVKKLSAALDDVKEGIGASALRALDLWLNLEAASRAARRLSGAPNFAPPVGPVNRAARFERQAEGLAPESRLGGLLSRGAHAERRIDFFLEQQNNARSRVERMRIGGLIDDVHGELQRIKRDIATERANIAQRRQFFAGAGVGAFDAARGGAGGLLGLVGQAATSAPLRALLGGGGFINQLQGAGRIAQGQVRRGFDVDEQQQGNRFFNAAEFSRAIQRGIQSESPAEKRQRELDEARNAVLNTIKDGINKLRDRVGVFS